jgi:hypothetical protein
MDGVHFKQSQRKFIRNSIYLMLSKLYKTIRALEDELNQADDNKRSTQQAGEELKWLKSQVTNIYKCNAGKEEVYVVGPMGERPIHTCAFALAEHLDMGEQHIADGIFDGMRDFLKKPENAAVLCEPYGKDYCAAVACFFQQKCKDKESLKDATNSVTVNLPYSKQIKLWLEKHWKSKIWGVYEGETVHFALIACGYHKAVEWLIKSDSNTTSASPDQNKWRRYRLGP